MLTAFIFLFIATEINAQTRRSAIDSGSYVWIGSTRINPYIEPFAELAPVKGERLQFVGLGGGILLNDRISVGGFFNRFIDDYQFMIIFPNVHRLNMVHGGMQVGYSWPVHQRIALIMQHKLGFGEILATGRSATDVFSGNNFVINQPSIGLDIAVLRFAKLHGNVGYRKIDQVKIQRLAPIDFEGFTFQVALKIGMFTRIKATENDG